MRLAGLLLAALVLAGCAQPEAEPTSDEGASWSLAAIDGATYTRDEPARNATVLFFMATWCGSCRAKAPILADVAADYAARGVSILSVGFDPSETPGDLRAWQERYRHPWPHGLDPELRIQRAFHVRAQSSVVVLDAEGRVVEHFGYGKVTDADLRAALDRALAASDVAPVTTRRV